MAEFVVESFERLPGAPGWVTLRLEGQWSGDLGALGSPELVIDDGRRDFTFPPASGAGTGIPTPGQRVWRVAFSVPDDILSGGKLAFAARLGGTIIDLPRPAEPVPASRRGAAITRSAPPSRFPAPSPGAAPAAAPLGGAQAELARVWRGSGMRDAMWSARCRSCARTLSVRRAMRASGSPATSGA